MSESNRKEYEEYLSQCEKENIAPLSYDEWNKRPTYRAAYKEYCEQCEDEDEEPISFEEFKETYKWQYKEHNWQHVKITVEEDKKKSDMSFHEYLLENASYITEDDLKPDQQQHAKHRPIRMYDALTALSEDPDLKNVKNKGETAEFRESVLSYCAVNRGLVLLNTNPTIKRIVKIDELLGSDLEDDEALDAIRTQRFKNTTKQSYRETHFYCGSKVKKFINKHADPLGLHRGDIAQYLWLLGISDQELNPKIRNSLLKTLEEFNSYFEDRLLNYERFAKRKGIELPDVE